LEVQRVIKDPDKSEKKASARSSAEAFEFSGRKTMRPVVIESPYSGDVSRNRLYLEACILDCLRRGETPYASHKMLTDALDDLEPEERKLGMSAGYPWVELAETSAIYIDLGVSRGMEKALKLCPDAKIERRTVLFWREFEQLHKEARVEDAHADRLEGLGTGTTEEIEVWRRAAVTSRKIARRMVLTGVRP